MKKIVRKPTIWLIKDAEPLPVNNTQRIYRTGLLAEELSQRDCKIVWFASRFEHARKSFVDGPSPILAKENYEIHLLDGPGYTKNISISRINHQRVMARKFTELTKNLEKPDLILVNYPAPELCKAASEFALENNIRYYVDFRDPWPDSFAEYFPKLLSLGLSPLINYYRRILKYCAKNATGVISMSNLMHDWAMGYACREKSNKDHIFYLGYPEPTQKREINIPERFSESNPLRCLFIGMFGKSYDGETVIDAMKHLQNQGINSVRCTMVGDGNYANHWKAKAVNLQNLDFPGWADQPGLINHLSSAHVGLIPLNGGITKYWMGNKLFEYSSQALATVNTASGEPKFMIEQNDIGQNVPAGDVLAVTEAIKAYLFNPALLKSHMINSQKTFYTHFNASHIYKKYSDVLINEVLECQKNVDRSESELSTAAVF